MGLALCAASAVLLVLSFPPHGYGALAFLALVPSLYARHVLARSEKEAAAYAALPWLLWAQWTLRGMWPGLLWLELVPGAAALLVFGAARLLGRPRLAALYPLELGACLVAFEWLRGLTPLGMAGFLSLTQSGSPWLLRPTAFGGAWILTLAIGCANGALLLAVHGRRVPRRWALALAGFFFACAVWPVQLGPSIVVAAIQPGVPLPEETGGFALDDLLKLTREAGPAELVVWPEAALAGPPRGLKFTKGTTVVVPFVEGAGKLVVVGPNGMSQPYVKQKPSFSSGQPAGPSKVRLFEAGGLTLGTLICFDFDFLALPRRLAAAGAVIIAAPSDDAYPGIAAWHHALLPLHAAQNGVAIVKADAAFVSTIVDASGRVVARLSSKVPTRGVLRASVDAGDGPTFYARHGDWLAGLCAVLWALLAWRSRR